MLRSTKGFISPLDKNFFWLFLKDLTTIILIEDDQNLDEVTVTATRPLFELEQGKMVVNVANSISAAGLWVIDMLNRSPGVSVNRQRASKHFYENKWGKTRLKRNLSLHLAHYSISIERNVLIKINSINL